MKLRPILWLRHRYDRCGKSCPYPHNFAWYTTALKYMLEQRVQEELAQSGQPGLDATAINTTNPGSD